MLRFYGSLDKMDQFFIYVAISEHFNSVNFCFDFSKFHVTILVFKKHDFQSFEIVFGIFNAVPLYIPGGVCHY